MKGRSMQVCVCVSVCVCVCVCVCARVCVKIMRIVQPQPICMPAVAQLYSFHSSAVSHTHTHTHTHTQYTHTHTHNADLTHTSARTVVICSCISILGEFFSWINVYWYVCMCSVWIHRWCSTNTLHSVFACQVCWSFMCCCVCWACINIHVCIVSMRTWAHRDDPLPWFPPSCSSAELHFRIQILLVSESETQHLTLWASLLPRCLLLLFSSFMKCIMPVRDPAKPRFLLLD